jgi:hypothetical protein
VHAGGVACRLTDVRVKGLERTSSEAGGEGESRSRTAWVTCEEVINDNTRVLATNIFQCDDAGKWWMVHHQGSMVIGAKD